MVIPFLFCWALVPHGRPDPQDMVAEMQAMGVELMISPYFHSVSKTSTNYPAAFNSGYLARDFSSGHNGDPALGYAGGYVYDLFNPQVSSAAQRTKHPGLFV